MPEEDNDNNNINKPRSDIDRNPNRSQQFLANERTFLAWLRTCIAVIGIGFIVSIFSIFSREFWLVAKGSSFPTEISAHYYQSSLLGIGILVLGIILIIYAFRNYLNTYENIINEVYILKHTAMYVTTISLVAFGIIIIVYLFVLSGSQ